MDLKIKEILAEKIASTCIGKLSPDDIDWVLKIRGDQIADMHSSEISKATFILAKYVTFLQAQSNIAEASFVYEKRKFEQEVARSIRDIKGKTVSEREVTAFEEQEHLRVLESEFIKAQTEFLLFKKLPDQLIEISNALKKELSRRTDPKNVNVYD